MRLFEKHFFVFLLASSSRIGCCEEPEMLEKSKLMDLNYIPPFRLMCEEISWRSQSGVSRWNGKQEIELFNVLLITNYFYFFFTKQLGVRQSWRQAVIMMTIKSSISSFKWKKTKDFWDTWGAFVDVVTRFSARNLTFMELLKFHKDFVFFFKRFFFKFWLRPRVVFGRW